MGRWVWHRWYHGNWLFQQVNREKGFTTDILRQLDWIANVLRFDEIYIPVFHFFSVIYMLMTAETYNK